MFPHTGSLYGLLRCLRGFLNSKAAQVSGHKRQALLGLKVCSYLFLQLSQIGIVIVPTFLQEWLSFGIFLCLLVWDARFCFFAGSGCCVVGMTVVMVAAKDTGVFSCLGLLFDLVVGTWLKRGVP